jgi:hypothetical protein
MYPIAVAYGMINAFSVEGTRTVTCMVTGHIHTLGGMCAGHLAWLAGMSGTRDSDLAKQASALKSATVLVCFCMGVVVAKWVLVPGMPVFGMMGVSLTALLLLNGANAP